MAGSTPARALTEVRAMGRVPVFVGGTGLYFKALTEGPRLDPADPGRGPRARARRGGGSPGGGASRPPRRHRSRNRRRAQAERPRPHPSRHRGGRGHWHSPSPACRRGNATPPLVVAARATRIVLDPPRPWLHQRIADRADRMVHDGAIEEALALGRLGLSPDLPAMKAIGVRQFLDHDAGKLTLAEALAAVKTETRRYAKRQVTWFRHQMADWRSRVVPADRRLNRRRCTQELYSIYSCSRGSPPEAT